MSRQNMTLADSLFFGKAAYGRANDSKRGVPLTFLTLLTLGAPVVGDADALLVAATSTELPNNATTTYTFPASNVSPTDGVRRDGILDVARNITAAVTHGSSVVAMTIRVTGTDEYGATLIEDLSIAATGTSQAAAGLKAFKTVTSVAITSAGNATTNTLNLGFGDVLGLPYRVDAGGVLVKLNDNALDTGTFVPADTTDPATATTGDVRGTFDPSVTLDGSKVIRLLVKIANQQTKVGSFGVEQYDG